MASAPLDRKFWGLLALLVAMPAAVWASSDLSNAIRLGIALTALCCWFALAIYLQSWVIGCLCVGIVLAALTPRLHGFELIVFSVLVGIMIEVLRMRPNPPKIAQTGETNSSPEIIFDVRTID